MSEMTQKQSPYSVWGEIRKAIANMAHHAKLLMQLGGRTQVMAAVMGDNSYLVINRPRKGRQQWKLRGVDRMVHSSEILEVYEPTTAKR